MKVIFIDNGVTGSIGWYDGSHFGFLPTPTVKMQDYTKEKKNVSRIDVANLAGVLESIVEGDKAGCQVVLERPLVNPARFNATVSAVRALEATISVLETMGLSYRFCDSKEWQRGLLPSSGHKGVASATLKQESRDIGIRMFPSLGDSIRKHKDADGILGAYSFWLKRGEI